MPSWILWLSPVIVAPLLAVAWITWVSRPKAAALKDPAPTEPPQPDAAPQEKQHRAS